MKHLTILVPDGQTTLASIACIVGATEMFTQADGYWQEAGREKLFNIQLAGVSDRTEFGNGQLTVRTDTHISAITKTHLIIIPSMIGSFQEALNGNKLLSGWVAEQYRLGAEVASMCTGAFLLASTGLLEGKTCSTHWDCADNFRHLFPNVQLRSEQLITDEQGIYTNGGGYSFLNLLIYLIEKYFDRHTAVYCSKTFQVEMDRQSQSPFVIFRGQKLHGDEVVKKAQTYIETNYYEKISTEDLSLRFAVGRRTFDRRFVKATGNTPTEYSQRVRVELAKKAFETTQKTVTEVMYEVGYSDIKAFREVFRKITGMVPLEYKNRYNKEAVV